MTGPCSDNYGANERSIPGADGCPFLIFFTFAYTSTDLNAFIRDILQFIFAAGPFDANIKLQRVVCVCVSVRVRSRANCSRAQLANIYSQSCYGWCQLLRLVPVHTDSDQTLFSLGGIHPTPRPQHSSAPRSCAPVLSALAEAHATPSVRRHPKRTLAAASQLLDHTRAPPEAARSRHGPPKHAAFPIMSRSQKSAPAANR